MRISIVHVGRFLFVDRTRIGNPKFPRSRTHRETEMSRGDIHNEVHRNRKKYSDSNETRNLFRHKSRPRPTVPSYSNFPSFQGHVESAGFLALVITLRISYSDTVRRRDSYEISLELFRSPNAARGSSPARRGTVHWNKK